MISLSLDAAFEAAVSTSIGADIDAGIAGAAAFRGPTGCRRGQPDAVTGVLLLGLAEEVDLFFEED